MQKLILAILAFSVSVHCESRDLKDVIPNVVASLGLGAPGAPAGTSGAPGAPAGQPATPGGSEGHPATPGGSEGHPGAPAAPEGHHGASAVFESSQGAPGASDTSGSDSVYDSSSMAMLKLITLPITSLYFFCRML